MPECKMGKARGLRAKTERVQVYFNLLKMGQGRDVGKLIRYHKCFTLAHIAMYGTCTCLPVLYVAICASMTQIIFPDFESRQGLSIRILLFG
jgi:hypothetical protein